MGVGKVTGIDLKRLNGDQPDEQNNKEKKQIQEILFFFYQSV